MRETGFAVSSRERNRRRYCSERCRVWRYRHPTPRPVGRICAVCSTNIDDRQAGATYCGEKCAQRARADRDRTFPIAASCARCGKDFTKDRGTQVYCSSRCYQAQYRQDHPEKFPVWDDAKKAAYHRRRARKRGAQTTKVVPAEVFERDLWICGLCGDPVDPALVYPDPQSASLDHRIPLSRGGSHDLENVQLAHLRCNIAKGNRILAP